jgi:hypothetical protein
MSSRHPNPSNPTGMQRPSRRHVPLRLMDIRAAGSGSPVYPDASCDLRAMMPLCHHRGREGHGMARHCSTAPLLPAPLRALPVAQRAGASSTRLPVPLARHEAPPTLHEVGRQQGLPSARGAWCACADRRPPSNRLRHRAQGETAAFPGPPPVLCASSHGNTGESIA